MLLILGYKVFWVCIQSTSVKGWLTLLTTSSSYRVRFKGTVKTDQTSSTKSGYEKIRHSAKKWSQSGISHFDLSSKEMYEAIKKSVHTEEKTQLGEGRDSLINLSHLILGHFIAGRTILWFLFSLSFEFPWWSSARYHRDMAHTASSEPPGSSISSGINLSNCPVLGTSSTLIGIIIRRIWNWNLNPPPPSET